MSQNWKEYDEFIAAAEKDNRIGDVTLTALSNTVKEKDGRVYHEIELAIKEAGGFRMRWFLPPTVPTPAEVKEAKDAGNDSIFKGKVQTVNFFKALDMHYGIEKAADITEGVTIRATTRRGRDRVDVMTGTTKPGFINIVKVLPSAGGSKPPVDDNPF